MFILYKLHKPNTKISQESKVVEAGYMYMGISRIIVSTVYVCTSRLKNIHRGCYFNRP